MRGTNLGACVKYGYPKVKSTGFKFYVQSKILYNCCTFPEDNKEY